MTDKKIVFKNPDGSIYVLTPADKGKKDNETEDEWIERIAEKDKPEGAIRMKNIIAKDLPTREFRYKWRDDGAGNIKVDDTIPDKEPPITLESLKAEIELLKAK